MKRYLLLTLWLTSGVAHANGALPATTQILLPASEPKTIIIGTNFGLVSSHDDGASWEWICEHDEGLQGGQYQLTAAPAVRVLGLASMGLVRSENGGCGWSVILDQSNGIAFDYFPDPTAPDHALAL